jgi:hypothetical protein
VLYIASPSYVFEIDEQGRVRYDDAVALAETWDELRASRWMWPPPAYAIDGPARLAAIARVRRGTRRPA